MYALYKTVYHTITVLVFKSQKLLKWKITNVDWMDTVVWPHWVVETDYRIEWNLVGLAPIANKVLSSSNFKATQVFASYGVKFDVITTRWKHGI